MFCRVNREDKFNHLIRRQKNLLSKLIKIFAKKTRGTEPIFRASVAVLTICLVSVLSAVLLYVCTHNLAITMVFGSLGAIGGLFVSVKLADLLEAQKFLKDKRDVYYTTRIINLKQKISLVERELDNLEKSAL